MKRNMQKLLVRAAILLVLAIGSVLSIYAMDSAHSGFESAGISAAVQQDVSVYSIQEADALTVTVSAPAGTYNAGDKIWVTLNFGMTVTLADGNLIVTFSNGLTHEVEPFEGWTTSFWYTVPTGYGVVPTPGTYAYFQTSAVAPFNVVAIALGENATLMAGSTSFTSFPLISTDFAGVSVNPAAVSPTAGCPTIPAFTPTEGGAPEAPSYICAQGNAGEPIISWRNDPNADWFNIWIGRLGTNSVTFYQALWEWYPKDPADEIRPGVQLANVTCEGLTCTLKPNITMLGGGEFQVWMQAWGNGSFSSGGSGVQIDPGAAAWNGPAIFTLPSAAPGPVTGMTYTVDNTGKISLGWMASEGSTWYNIWLGTAPTEWSPRSFVWIDAETLGCLNGGMCWVTPGTPTLNNALEPGVFNVTLAPDDYIFYVQSWGLGQFNTGGIDNTSWVPGPTFTIDATS